MLMNIKCSTVTSIEVHLTFDDNSRKDRIISKGDLIEVEFNYNGIHKHVIGKVLKISAEGTDPNGWYIMVDSSDSFDANQYRFCVMNILDIEIIRKADVTKYIETPTDCTGIAGLRIVKGRLQYTLDGFNWNELHIDRRSIIKDEEGTIPERPHHHHHPHGSPFPYNDEDDYMEDELVIRDETL